MVKGPDGKVTKFSDHNTMGIRTPESLKTMKRGYLMMIDDKGNCTYNKVSRKRFLKRQKHESQYSVIGNLLAKERSLKKYLKRLRRRAIRMHHDVGAAIHLFEPSHTHGCFPIYSEKALIPHFDSREKTSGYVASSVIPNGKYQIGLHLNLKPNLPNLPD